MKNDGNGGNGGEWQPIETAPKDGNKIIVWSDIFDGIVTTAYWYKDDYTKCWMWYLFGARSVAAMRVYQPTHWCPLLPQLKVKRRR